MDGAKPTPRRVRVEPNIYRRSDGKLELGYRDSSGTQRWKVIDGGIMAARKERDTIKGSKAKGENVQPNPKLTFGIAADKWLKDQVSLLAPNTQASYRNSIEKHVRPRWGNRRMDRITVDDAAKMIRELQDEGKSPHTIQKILVPVGRVFRFAQRRMKWYGENPVALLDKSERPTLDYGSVRPFTEAELTQTLMAAREPYRTMFELAVETGARLSEILGLVWGDINFDTDRATVAFEYQLDANKERVKLKTDEGWAVLPISRRMVRLLAEHKLRSHYPTNSGNFVFTTRGGRGLNRHDVLTLLKRTMKRAIDENGRPTFPVMYTGAKLPRGTVPTFHSFRHSAAMDCETPEEAQMLLRHKKMTTTTTVYRRHFSQKRQEALRARVEARVEATEGNSGQQPATGQLAEVAQLQRIPTNGKA